MMWCTKLIWNIQFLLFVTLLDPTKAVEGKDKKKPQCGKGYSIEGDKPAEINLNFPEDSSKCQLSFFGGAGCAVELSCAIDIPKADDCSKEFLKVSDGSSGEKVFCGKTEFTVVPNSGLRHIFLVLETNVESNPQSHKVSCTATCSKSEGERLGANTKRKLEDKCVCGLQNKDDRLPSKEDSLLNEFPWQAALVYPNTRSPFCSGALINDRFILTAAHCFWFAHTKPEQVQVLLRTDSIITPTRALATRRKQPGSEEIEASAKSDADENSLRLNVSEIIIHPLVNDYYDYDFALVRLQKEINLVEAPAPTPICLPAADIGDEELAKWVGKSLTVTGWGLVAQGKNGGGVKKKLQKLNAPLTSPETCKRSAPEYVTDRIICAGVDSKDACSKKDSGSPLIKQTESKQWRQVGIASLGDSCERAGQPGVYSKVTEVVQWIHFHTTDRGVCMPVITD